MTDFRALCAELLDEFVYHTDWSDAEKLKERARAALAEPEPEGPTLDDIWELCEEHGFVLGIDGAHEDESAEVLLSIARAVLARWGNPAPQPPAPVTENPTDEDLLILHDWMTDEWAANHDFELPPSQYARAVLTCWGRPESVPNPWKDTLLDALVCNFLLNAENEDDPRKALSDLIAWEKQLATDPLINPPSLPDTND